MESLLSHYTPDYILAFAILLLATWIVPVVSTALDLWSGIDRAKARGETVYSGGLRKTITKIGDYWKVQTFALMIDLLASMWLAYPFASLLAGLGIIYIEGKSVIENLKLKKSSAASIPNVIEKILNASTNKQAEEVVQLIKLVSK